MDENENEPAINLVYSKEESDKLMVIASSLSLLAGSLVTVGIYAICKYVNKATFLGTDIRINEDYEVLPKEQP